MPNELSSTLLIAGLAGVLCGLVAGWLTSRRRATVEPAIEAQRQHELQQLRESFEQESAARGIAEARLRDEEQKLLRAAEHIHSLESQVGDYLRQYAQAKDTLKKEILQKASLRAELAAASAQVETLQARIQELRMSAEASAPGVRRKVSL
jgi:chromosome segregation ATPase